jgi:outer membrane protein assembly factor BamB
MNMYSSKLFHGRLVWSLALFVCGAISAQGNDWPQWRGVNRDDICTETGLLQQWPAGGPRLLWKATELGAGYSGLAVVGPHIYTAGAKGEFTYVMALNAADGKQVWSSKLGHTEAPGGFEGPRGTPTVDGDLLFALDQSGALACFQTADGKLVWQKDFIKDFGGESPRWGFAESPLVDGDKLVITPGGSEGSIVALDKKTGTLLWRSQGFTDEPHYSSLIIAEIAGVRQYIQLTSASVVGVAAADGKVLWRAARKGNVAVVPTPIYSDGYVYVSSGYGNGCNLFKVTASDGKFSASQVYANKVMGNHHGGVIKVGGFLYGYSDGKGWTCQDFKDGQVRWQDKDHLGKGSLAYADGRFYLRSEDKRGTIALIEATPTSYEEHGRFDQPDRSDKNSWPHPVIAEGKLFLRDQDVLLCYQVKAQ